MIRSLSSILSRMASATLLASIAGYKRFLSPLLPPACRYHPTCSAYAMEAIRLHGPLRGSGLALLRLLRCHPITWLGGSSGFDPVPPRHSH